MGPNYIILYHSQASHVEIGGMVLLVVVVVVVVVVVLQFETCLSS